MSQYRQNSAAIRSPPFFTADGLQDVYWSLPKWERNWLQYPPLIEFYKGKVWPSSKWPFDYKVTLVLVDQTHRRHIWHRFQPDHDNPSFQRPQSNSNVLYNFPQFAELSVLDDGPYVKEDVMYIKCIVDTTNIFHPWTVQYPLLVNSTLRYHFVLSFALIIVPFVS